MSIIVILNFAVDDDDYIYFFQFSSALLQKPFRFIVGFLFYGYAVCVLHVVLKHFREIKKSLSPKFSFFFFICLIPTVFSSQCPLGLTYSVPVKVAVIESRHGTTHCLNTVDHSKWSQETNPVKINAPHTPTGLNLQHLLHFSLSDEPHLVLCRHLWAHSTNITPVWFLTVH